MEEVLAISESFGDLSFPAMTAAGAAVHMGLGKRGVVIAELALERGLTMGSDVSESRVTLALALCQAGRPEDALGHLHETDTTSSYAASVSALALAMVGDAAGAIESAAFIDESSSTYLDRVVADVAAAAVEIRLGEHDAALERLVRADVTAREAGDVVARSLVTAASQAMVDRTDVEFGHLGPGWRRALDGLAAVALHRPDDVAVEPA
jgi:thioredoxin-like negative regulator of GroEL